MSCKLGSTVDGLVVRAVAWKRIEPNAGEAGQAVTVSASELDQVLQELRATQDRLLEVEQSIEPLQREAWEKGFRAGQAEARQAAEKEIEQERQRFAKAIAYMVEVRAEWRRQIENDAVALAMAVARRVLNRELSVDADAVQAIVRVAIEKANGQDLRRVRVSAAQAPTVRTCLAQAAPGVELVPDQALQTGQVLFEMGQGALDASVEAQLEEIERGFADAVAR
jgi:flagellar assembly protein FliH